MSDAKKKLGWKWPLGIVATSLAGAGVVLFWPVRAQGHCYQVCLGCGIKRLFDEKAFRGYGPYQYDLNRLITWDRDQSQSPSEQRPA